MVYCSCLTVSLRFHLSFFVSCRVVMAGLLHSSISAHSLHQLTPLWDRSPASNVKPHIIVFVRKWWKLRIAVVDSLLPPHHGRTRWAHRCHFWHHQPCTFFEFAASEQDARAAIIYVQLKLNESLGVERSVWSRNRRPLCGRTRTKAKFIFVIVSAASIRLKVTDGRTVSSPLHHKGHKGVLMMGIRLA